jgi:hypothetical protein
MAVEEEESVRDLGRTLDHRLQAEGTAPAGQGAARRVNATEGGRDFASGDKDFVLDCGPGRRVVAVVDNPVAEELDRSPGEGPDYILLRSSRDST